MASKSIVDVAKAQVIAYNEKDWDAARASLAPRVVYDEVGTQRRIEGVDEVLSAWRGWATAIPDSRATFDAAHTSGEIAILELTWRGTHKGVLQMPGGEIAATGKKIEIRACQVVEVAGDKVKSIRHYFDMATLLQQIGAMGERATAHGSTR
jgi:steroid delta-isomerase-like uncharacterized protein